jgi:hypothetical protein
MTETITLPTAIKLAYTKLKEPQVMNNTIPKLTIIYYSETTEEPNRPDDDKHNP